MHPRQIAGVAGSCGTDGVDELALHAFNVGSPHTLVKGGAVKSGAVKG